MKKQDGDLETIEITEHIDNPKKFGIFGVFKGSPEKIILARIGEGDEDPRSPELIRLTAECVAKEIGDIYAMMALQRYAKRS